MDDRLEILGETTGTPLAVSGKSGESLLIRLVTSIDPEKRMPPEGRRLKADEIAVLRAWIDQGLPWDETLLPPVIATTNHWAFQTVKRPAVPEARNPAWVANPIDAFIAAKHVDHGLSPALPASRRTLIRRLSLDLIGLPPTPAEVEAFLADGSFNAYESLVERLLASPHYGERWARHWLDVARWAESEGYESNHPRPFAWRYRDYVVESFNADKPFDLFLRQQIAGDEMVPYSDENLNATGFLAAARMSSNEEDKWRQRNDMLVDVVNATGSAFLGLTINCAQCHNHKFDPITIRDYYRLLGYFTQGQPVNAALQSPDLRREYESQRPTEYEPALALKEAIFNAAKARRVEEAKQKLPAESLRAVETPAGQRTVEQERLARDANLAFQFTPDGIEKAIPDGDRKLYDEVKKKVAEIEKTSHVEPQTFAFYSPVTSPHRLKQLPMLGFYPLPFDPQELARTRSYLRIRGEVHGIGPALDAGWPAVFDSVRDVPDVVRSLRDRTGGSRSDPPTKNTRTALADWLTDPRHPLTARVWVNRLWHHHFGRGIVATLADFGVRGAPPTHPKLLDWLAAELVESKWSTKHIHRLIVTSNTYRQSSRVEPAEANATSTQSEIQNPKSEIPPTPHSFDPENRYLPHFAPRRLEAEALRDALLAVTGELDRKTGGPSVKLEEREASTRRTLYLFQKRGVPPAVQSLFDGPVELSESCAQRHTSTTALQSLYLLNNGFVLKRARELAVRVVMEAGSDRSRQIEAAFVRVLGRPPDEEERKDAESFFLENGETASDARGDLVTTTPALVTFCHALLNLNEFAYIE